MLRDAQIITCADMPQYADMPLLPLLRQTTMVANVESGLFCCQSSSKRIPISALNSRTGWCRSIWRGGVTRMLWQTLCCAKNCSVYWTFVNLSGRRHSVSIFMFWWQCFRQLGVFVYSFATQTHVQLPSDLYDTFPQNCVASLDEKLSAIVDI